MQFCRYILWLNIKIACFQRVTAHYLDPTDFILHCAVLATKQIVDSHNGKNLVEWTEDVLSTCSISAYQVTAVATDNSANIVKAKDFKRKV